MLSIFSKLFQKYIVPNNLKFLLFSIFTVSYLKLESQKKDKYQLIFVLQTKVIPTESRCTNSMAVSRDLVIDSREQHLCACLLRLNRGQGRTIMTRGATDKGLDTCKYTNNNIIRSRQSGDY